jgi:hypothetical protein
MDSLSGRVDESHVAWASGLFDGEGSIGIQNKGYLTLRLSVTDEFTIRRFRECVGVGTLRMNGPRLGRIQSWIWFIGARRNVEVVLRKFLPTLVTKRPQARLALRYMSLEKSDPEREDIKRSLKGLKCRRYAGSRHPKFRE